MPPSVEVREIDALEDLQTGLIRYADQAQAALAAIAREVQRTLEWLEERQRHWRAEVQRGREEEHRAKAAYQRCLSSGDADHPPQCDREEQVFYEARRRLAQAEAEERMATQARQAVQAEAEAYARDANRLRATLQSETVKSVEVLRHKVTVLRSYASGGISASGALVFGAGLAAGATLGTPGTSSVPGDIAQPLDPAGGMDATTGQSIRERSLQELHPDIHDILLDQIDLTDSPVQNETDFNKVSHAEVIAGLEKLSQVRRWIGSGATDQWLYDVDQEARAQGMPEAQSHHNIYKVFYGDDAIALEKVGDRYHVLNGYHPLAVARELGWTTIPARVVTP